MRLREIVVDSIDPPKLARFWSMALGEFEIRVYDDVEIARLASLGFTPQTDPNVALDGPMFTIFFQKSNEPKNQRNRIHFDLEALVLDAEIEKLVSHGARLRDRHDDFVVMLDPEGNEFCVKERQA